MFTKFRLMAALVLSSVGGWIGYERVEWLRSQVEAAQPHFDRIVDLIHGVADKCRDNPVPIYVAVAWFSLTFVYHWAKGKSFRESVEVAATRVKVVEQPTAQPVSPVIEKAQASVIYLQLVETCDEVEAKIKRLNDERKKADEVAAKALREADQARLTWLQKQKQSEEATAKLLCLNEALDKTYAGRSEIKKEMERLEKIV
jgi:hypothetical protein